MSADIVLLIKAMEFAARVHVHQRRKGKVAEPYINHPIDVCYRLAEATNGEDVELMVAGLLHDTMEDQGVSFDELKGLFGVDVASLVEEVTDDMSLAKPERKLMQVKLAAGKSPRAKKLRLADKTSNLYSLFISPPLHWEMERRQAYFEWAKQVADNCRGVCSHLERKFDEAYQLKSQLIPDSSLHSLESI